MLQILGGQWSGRRLKTLERDDLRPTSGRVKAALFSILEAYVWKREGAPPDFSAWRCLDLFAGVGGLGLEILSRGAAHCVFVEKNRSHARVLQENISALGCGSSSQVIVGAVEEGAWESAGPFDLVLLDPPYAGSNLPHLLGRLADGSCLKAGAVILFEHDPKVELGEVPGLTLQSTRKLGPAGITVYVRDA
ncbi:MAG TPA: 16S rRNA (guanine(966)-N(2))-methyltransferase RsmD [Bdellovibrionota bacterium]|jgi:16S rRNA (guanine966-N2)-methyltransferase